ncbi:MAG: hypothetical protein ACLSAF_22020 [Intestinimonas sp.]
MLAPAASALPAPTENPAAQEETEPGGHPLRPPPGSSPGPEDWKGDSPQRRRSAAAQAIAGGSSPVWEKGDAAYSEAHGMVLDPNTGKDKYLTDPVPEGKPLPVEPQDASISDTAYTCTLSISCATILTTWTGWTLKRWSRC